MAREVTTSMVIEAVSNTDQWPYRMQYRSRRGPVPVFVLLDGLLTRAA